MPQSRAQGRVRGDGRMAELYEDCRITGPLHRAMERSDEASGSGSHRGTVAPRRMRYCRYPSTWDAGRDSAAAGLPPNSRRACRCRSRSQH